VAALRDNDTVDTFIKRADEAMYEAKNGRNQVVLAK
jgi:PleD family two-component response regulator